MVLAFYAPVLEHTLSEEERSQILQTIEMFEVITQTQQDDYQSLEILKVAYRKLGKHEEALRVSRRLAEAYFGVGSYGLALQECEAILAIEPESPAVAAMMSTIESKLKEGGQTKAEAGAHNALTAGPDYTAGPASLSSGLLEIGGRNTGQVRKREALKDAEQGNDQLAKFLVLQQMFPEEDVNAALEAVKEANRQIVGQTLATSLLERLCQGDDNRLEYVLSALIDRTKFAYVPLEYYDIDRQVVRMLPDDLTVNRLFVPFDLVSRTIMVAVCNPFDAEAREAVQQSLDYTVTWYLAKPATIIKTLQEIYKLEARS